MITLKGKDVLSKMTVAGDSRLDKNDVPYFIGRHAGLGFTLRTDVYTDWKAGNIAEISFDETTYVNEAGDTINSLSYGGHMTYTQAIGVAKNEKVLSTIEKSYMEISSELSPETLSQLANA